MTIRTFSHYSALSIYVHDYANDDIGKITLDELGFHCKNPFIKVKFLSNDTLDIVNIDGKFISDITLNSQQKNYISGIDLVKCPLSYNNGSKVNVKQLKKVDYEIDMYWALTSKIRGYAVDFKYAYDMNKINNKWASIMSTQGQSYGYNEDELWSSSADDSDEYEDSYKKPQVFVRNVKVNEKVARSNSLISMTTMFVEVVSKSEVWAKNIIVIEYFFNKCNYCSVKKIGEKTTVIEMYITDYDYDFGEEFHEPKSKIRVCSLILVGSVNCNGVAKRIYSDEGVYTSGINFYKKENENTVGAIFCGEQIGNGKGYAGVLYEDIIVPDLLLTKNSEAYLNNPSAVTIKFDEDKGYDYEEFKKIFNNA